MASDRGKLEPALAHALEVWRVRSARSKELAGRKITVFLEFTGNVADLEAAGLNAGPLERGQLYGVIAMKDVERLAAVPGVGRIDMEVTGQPALDTSVKEARVPWKDPPGFTGKGQGVIVAVIDSGIDIFHESFRLPGNVTRILELWDQGAEEEDGGSAPPAGTPGRIFSKEEIEEALEDGPELGFGSEDTNGHGTHVAGIAAGNGSQDDRCADPGTFVGVAPEADLVIVKAISLPEGATSNIREALTWCAAAGGRHSGPDGPKPVVINCSFGSDTGAHDGNERNDVRIGELLRPAGGPIPAGLAVVASAGNEGEGSRHEAGTVAGVTAAEPSPSVTIPFYLPRNSKEDDPIHIWYDGAATFDVSIAAPPVPPAVAEQIGPIPPGPEQTLPIAGMQVTITSPVAGDPQHGNKKDLQVSLSLADDAEDDARMRSGRWTITLTNTAAVAGNFDIWIKSSRSDGYPTFEFPNDPSDTPARRRNNTVHSPGTCRDAITVANYDESAEIYISSSRGPANYPNAVPAGERKPTIAAPGTAIRSARSTASKREPTSSCCVPQKAIDITGTSQATPHVAGLVALMFEKNRNLTFEQVRAHLQHSARLDGIPNDELPADVPGSPEQLKWGNIWGSGKVDARVALNEIPPAVLAAPSGGGGGGGGTIFPAELDERELGYTPHTIFSRLGEWRRRLGPRPGLMLMASLVSEHVDEILRLINRNHKVGATWRKNGGPILVRHLLYSSAPQATILPAKVPGCDVDRLIPRFLPILQRFGSARLRADITRFGSFARAWPGSEAARLDELALLLEAKR